jgi:hypothetical protein
VTPDDFNEIRWRGHWIWLPEAQEAPAPMSPFGPQSHAGETHGFFRKSFTLTHLPERAPTRITADSRYLLWVNGQEVYRGPVRSQPRRLHYDLFDLAPYLQRGQNLVAVYVKYYGRPTSYWIPAAPNMTLGKTGVMVFEANLGEGGGWLVSDATWKALEGEAWAALQADGSAVTHGVPIEIFDARRYPAGWQSLGFDDTLWPQARVIPAVHIGGFAHTQPPTDPYGPLYPRTIAKLGGEIKTPVAVAGVLLRGVLDPDIVDPVDRVSASAALEVATTLTTTTLPVTTTVPEDGAIRLRLDMGGIVSGFVQFSVQALAGTVFDLQYTEEPALAPLGSMLGMHCGTRYVAHDDRGRGHDEHFQVFDSNGFRYAHILIHGTSGSVTLKAFAVRENIYPWADGAGFRCSDDELNALFTAGIRTVQLNSHDAFLDCPTREQRAWVGDSVVHQMVHLATNPDWRLARHNVILGNSPRSDGILPMSVVGEIEAGGGYTIPDWALHWVHAVHNLYRFEGDRALIKSLLPTVERILRWYVPYQASNGLLKDVVEWNLIDWSSVHTEDISAAINASWARGLREFAEMAGWLGESASQSWAEALYARVEDGFEAFWDEDRGSYVDHIVDGEPRKPMSQIPGTMAICAGLAPKDRWVRIIDTITDLQTLVIRSWTGADGTYSQEKMMRQLRGIYEADWDVEHEIVSAEPFMSYVVHDAVAKAGLADRLPDLYRRWSEFLVDGYDTIGECWGWGTHVHGWSCTPTKDMIFYTLGVTPAEPGYASARVAPRLGTLAWAEGTVPTPYGPIHVRAEKERVTIDSPVPVRVDLPGQAPQSLPAGQHALEMGS